MVTSKLNRLKVAILGLLLTMVVFTLNVKTAVAHYPHDDIFAVEISPNYRQDQTLFINVRGNLFKSVDGGDNWQTIVKGLDYQNELSALDISAKSPKVLYLSSLGSGIFKSENGGDSWSQINQGLETLSLDLVAIAPHSSESVLAAGTESGLYKTDNGGISWLPIMTGESKITAMAFDPWQPGKIIVGDNQGKLFASRDRGESWQQLSTFKDSGAITSVAISPNYQSDRTVWVGTEQAGVWHTVDGGISFSKANQGISDRAIVKLAISPNYQRDGTILASTWHEGIFRSINNGKSWEKHNKGLTKDKQADSPNFQRPHFSDLSISQTFSEDQTVFIAGFDGLFKSENKGTVWREMNTLSANIIVGLDLSPDYQQDSTLAITTYLGGAYLSQDAGTTWTTINKGLAKDKGLKRIAKKILREGYVARLFGIEFSPNYSQDQTIFAPSWTDFLKSTDQGQNWQKSPLGNLPNSLKRPTKYAIATSPNFAIDQTIYLGSMGGKGKDFVLKSTDGGLSFSKIGSIKGQSAVYMAISQNFALDQTLFAGVKDGVYKTVDGGITWEPTGDGMPPMPGESKLAISPSYKLDQTIFAGTASGLFVTRDGGNNWGKLAGTGDGKTDYIDAVAISPNYQSDHTLIMSIRGRGLFKSVDGGESFIPVGENLLNSNYSLANMSGFWPPTTAIKFSPTYAHDSTIYGVSTTNLFKSQDGGHIWTSLPLPKYQKTSIKQLLAYYYFRLTVFPLTKFLLAGVIGLVSYLILERFKLDKKLPLRKIIIKTSGAFTVFIVTFMLFSV